MRLVSLHDYFVAAYGLEPYKTDLSRKFTESQPKLNAAATNLDETNLAGADRWETVGEEVANAVGDLKKEHT